MTNQSHVNPWQHRGVSGREQLAALIAQKKESWEGALWLERELHGTEDPDQVAAKVEGFCEEVLGSGIVDAIAYAASVGTTYGVILDGDRSVAVKGHRSRLSSRFLASTQAVLAALRDDGFPCPAPVAGPSPFGTGNATVETWLDEPPAHDGHDPGSIRAVASCLADLIARSSRLGLEVDAGGWSMWPASPGELWPEPHSELFDLRAPMEHAAEIERVAAAALLRLRDDAPSRPPVLGHGDLSPHNARYDPETDAVVAVYDWDSIGIEPEAFFVGINAASCTADWSREVVERPRAPSLDEATLFVDAYIEARGRPFTSQDRLLVGAAYAYATAYSVRLGDHEEDGGFLASGTITTILEHGLELLEPS